MSSSQASLRVAFVTNFIPPYWKSVLTALSRRVAHLRIFVSTPMESNRAWQTDWEGLDVVLQKTLTLPARSVHPKGFTEAHQVHLPVDTVQQLLRFRAHVVISAEMGLRTLLSVVYRKLRPSSRLIVYADVSAITEQGRGRIRKGLRRMLQRHVDAAIVSGESGADYMRGIGTAPDKIFKVPYATDVDRFASLSLHRCGASANRLLYVGQLIERKGLLQFIEALSAWLGAHATFAVELVIVGDGPLRTSLESLSTPTNLQLTFTGNLDYFKMPEIYAQAGVFVFPTFADTWGLVVNEALAAGLPVLGSAYSQAVQELVVDGWNGWLFRADQRAEMYDAIERCMFTEPSHLEDMREKARTTALRFTPESMALSIERVVRSTASAHCKQAQA